MQSQSIHSQVLRTIKAGRTGSIYFADDFTSYGSPETVNKILLRIENDGFIVRLAYGIYLKPKKSSLLGILFPSIEELATEIAKRDKARIIPTGIYALYILGLTTQIPLKIVYLTDGSQREVKIGKRFIKFKKAAPRNFAIKDSTLNLIIQAFKEKRLENIDADFTYKISPHVQKIENKIILDQIKYAPVWVQKEIKKIREDVD